MSEVALPSRPRLADHAMPRRHFIDGAEIVVVHDTRSGDLVRMPPRAWAVIEAADGTRDMSGVLLAASQRPDPLRPSEVAAVLTDLMGAGLLTDGIDPFAFEPMEADVAANAPLDVLDFALTCDGSGACCATYSTVRFSEIEADRARSLLPDLEGGRARRFLPLVGSGAQPQRAATLIDGRCGYLGADAACEIHRRGGFGAKPAGCAIYPATFAWDGAAVRVSLGVECACVAKSLDSRGGSPLVPEAARARSDLPEGAQIVVVPDRIEVRAGVTAPREAIVAWSREVLAAMGGAPRGSAAIDGAPRGASVLDVVAIAWALAAKIEAGETSAESVRAALDEARGGPPSFDALSPWIEALRERAAAKREAADRWRSIGDRVRRASALLADAAEAMNDPVVLAEAIVGTGAPRALEAFYFRSNVHGHGMIGEAPLATALRDRATRVLFGRAVARLAEERGSDLAPPGTWLTLVEAMMRAQGLKEYARAIG